MSAELVIYRGLPASGKTTLAKAWVAEDPAGRARVNRDDLRVMLHDGVYKGRETEGQVINARNQIIRRLLNSGVSVASDDTNLPADTVRDLARLARNCEATVRVVDLTDVEYAVCVIRDSEREKSVGSAVIQGMYERYVKGRPTPLPVPSSVTDEPPKPQAYEPQPGARLAIMVDLDGTLALHNGRSPYDESRVGEDLPNRAVVETIRAIRKRGITVIYCSGRSTGCRDETVAWIKQHVGDEIDTTGRYTPLFMRAADDKRKDSIVKREIFDQKIRDHFDVLFVLDDRQQVVDAWREIGLTVFQVAPGDF